MRASLHTLGCRLNQAETAILEEKLRAAGYDIVPFGESADLGIINTCTVTNEADAKSRKAVRAFIRNNPRAFVAVIGCYSQMGAHALAAIDGVDLIVGNQEKLDVLHYVTPGKRESPLIIRDRIERDDFTIDTAGLTSATRRANLKIQDGCDFMCAFCIIPFARGRARSRELGDLLIEARALVESGAKEIILTGVNIGTYAYRGAGILDVLHALGEVSGLKRLRISSIEPTTIPFEIFDLMNDPAHPLLPFLHIPVQSGSNAVLDRMRRRYTREEFLDFVRIADETVPGIGIGTDLLAGMPGETDDDFAETADLLRESPIFYAHVFKYSERSGAASARMPNQVSPETIARRAAVLRGISAEKTRERHELRAGAVAEVLFERQDAGYWTGYTGDYVRVAVCSDDMLENEIRNVVLGQSRGEFMTAELAECAESVSV